MIRIPFSKAFLLTAFCVVLFFSGFSDISHGSWKAFLYAPVIWVVGMEILHRVYKKHLREEQARQERRNETMAGLRTRYEQEHAEKAAARRQGDADSLSSRVPPGLGQELEDED